MPTRTGISPERNKGSARSRLAPLLRIGLVILILSIWYLPIREQLTVFDERTGRMLLTLPIAAGEEFYLRYTHSVNLSDVTDGIEWTGDTLMVRSTLFKSYGVGMPVLADGIGTHFENTPDGFLITGIDRPEPGILLLLQEVPNNRLLYRGREINLLDRFGSGTLIRIHVCPVSIMQTLLYKE